MNLTDENLQELTTMNTNRTLLSEDILENVYRIKVESRIAKTSESKVSYGTGFTVFRDKRIYLITAAHLFKPIHFDDMVNSIWIQHANRWKEIGVYKQILGDSSLPETDIAVLRIDGETLNRKFNYNRQSPIFDFEIKSNIPKVGHQIIFVGYPFLDGEVSYLVKSEDSYKGFPKPFLKIGYLSYYVHDPLKLFVDGSANKGFSGGPIMYRDEKNILYYCGILSKGRNDYGRGGYNMICGGMGTVNEFIDHLENS